MTANADPWNRPSLEDLRRVLESIGKSEVEHGRSAERLELSVPAEITTGRGNVISAMTREISRFGIGLLHRGNVSPGEVTIRMASETREFEYRVLIEWASPCDNGMFMSGGRFITQDKPARPA
ncbi:MAG: PilZ domain-containing protein [Planctomyces sp.]|nr:PilZ domain-containing protein [Planctomyces sp.]